MKSYEQRQAYALLEKEAEPHTVLAFAQGYISARKYADLPEVNARVNYRGFTFHFVGCDLGDGIEENGLCVQVFPREGAEVLYEFSVQVQ
jgi:hypothetical protein